MVGYHFLYVRNRAKDLPAAPSIDSLIVATHAPRDRLSSLSIASGRWDVFEVLGAVGDQAVDVAVAGGPAAGIRG